MKNYQIKITLLSDTLIGSGEGYGTIIDTDIVHDNFGLPYIPAKRIKGVLLESAEMLNAILNNFKYSIPIEEIFGVVGISTGQLKVNNLYLNQHNEIREWIKYLMSKFSIINKQRVLNQLTSIRHSTAIDDKTGIAREHSLRTERVLNKGLIFKGDIEIEKENELYLALICQNVRRIGTKRNRGLGEVKVELLDENNQNLFETAL